MALAVGSRHETAPLVSAFSDAGDVDRCPDGCGDGVRARLAPRACGFRGELQRVLGAARLLLAWLAATPTSAAEFGSLSLLGLLAGYIIGANMLGYPSSAQLIIFWGVAALHGASCARNAGPRPQPRHLRFHGGFLCRGLQSGIHPAGNTVVARASHVWDGSSRRTSAIVARRNKFRAPSEGRVGRAISRPLSGSTTFHKGIRLRGLGVPTGAARRGLRVGTRAVGARVMILARSDCTTRPGGVHP